MAYKNIEPKVAAVNANSVCRQMSQNTAEQEFAAPDEFVAEVQWSMAIRKLIAGLEFGDALKLLMNDRDMSVEQTNLSIFRCFFIILPHKPVGNPLADITCVDFCQSFLCFLTNT